MTTNPPTAFDKLTAQACEDCVPVLELMRAPGIAGEVIVAIVRHQDSCPWFARVQPDPDSPIGTPYLLPYGDFQEFVIVDRIGTTMEFIQNVMGANGRPTAQRGALLWHRSGSDATVTSAFRLLSLTTAA